MLIITSSINAPETIDVLNRIKNLTHTKALLIDIIGSVLNNQNDFLQNLNSQKDNNNNLPTNHTNNLYVLTILTDRFKMFLNYSFRDEFEKWYDDANVNGNSDWDVGDEFFSLIENIFNREKKINRSDDEVVMKIRKYVRDRCDTCGNSIRAHISYCEEKVKRAQQSYSDGKSICEDIFKDIDIRQKTPNRVVDRTRTSLTLQHNIHPLFGEFFSLFDFIASATMPLSEYNDANRKYDFIVLDLQIVTHGVNKTTFSWRPFMLLHQNQLNQQIFTTEAVLPERNDWLYRSTTLYRTCGLQCWIITILALVLFVISLVVCIAVGIAVR